MRSFVLTLLLCFAASSLWAQAEIVKHPIQISDWLTVGPFSSGSRERGIDFLSSHEFCETLLELCKKLGGGWDSPMWDMPTPNISI